MELNRQNIKRILWIITFTVLLFVGLQHFSAVMGFVNAFFRLISPFIIGLCIAFILNVPMRFFDSKLFRSKRKPAGKWKEKLRRPLSLGITLLIFIIVIAAVLFLILPELGRTVELLANSFPGYVENVQNWLSQFEEKVPEISDWISKMQINWDKIGEGVIDFLKNGAGSILDTTVNAAASVVTVVTNFFLGIVFAIYVLMKKETLSRQVKGVLYAFLPEKAVDKTISVCRLSNRTFSRFLSGQCLEAVILGFMFFVALNIFNFPYALLISVLIGVLALIPIFGAFVGLFIGAFLILIINPIQAFWFVIMFFVIQQIEGNFIFPHVVGNSVSLPSLWVLVAVTIGGSMMGVVGMLIFIPLCSVIYALLKETVGKRLRNRQISKAKLAAKPLNMRKGGKDSKEES